MKQDYVVSALYHFVRLENFQELKAPLLDTMLQNQVKGTLLLAAEGINGTIAGTRQGIDSVLTWIRSDDRLSKVETKESYTKIMPFYRSKVKLKKEIVTMGVEGIDPRHIVGTYVKPQDWNALLDDPEVVLIDTRNDYEYQIGSFERAINPKTDTFREFPDYVKDNLNPEKHKKVAMFCTGGIRCEKSTAFLKEQGFEEVYHLQGGILKYLEEVPKEQTKWHGECFVFDNRVAVNHDLEQGSYDQCYACRYPITKQDKQSQYYQKGVSCPHCYEKTSPEQRRHFAEREKQMQLAKQRGEQHIGMQAAEQIQQRRRQKIQHKQQQQQQQQRQRAE